MPYPWRKKVRLAGAEPVFSGFAFAGGPGGGPNLHGEDAVLQVQVSCLAGFDLVENDHLGDRIFNLLLQRPANSSCSGPVVKAHLDQEISCPAAYSQPKALHRHPLFDLGQLEREDPLDLSMGQEAEGNDGINPVQEFRPEVVLQRILDETLDTSCLF